MFLHFGSHACLSSQITECLQDCVYMFFQKRFKKLVKAILLLSNGITTVILWGGKCRDAEKAQTVRKRSSTGSD